jgi:hypothetical protein
LTLFDQIKKFHWHQIFCKNSQNRLMQVYCFFVKYHTLVLKKYFDQLVDERQTNCCILVNRKTMSLFIQKHLIYNGNNRKSN